MSETADIDKTDVIKHKNIFKRKKLSFLKLTYFIALQGALALPYAGNTLLQGQKKLKKEQKELLAANRNVTADRMTEEQAAEIYARKFPSVRPGLLIKILYRLFAISMTS